MAGGARGELAQPNCCFLSKKTNIGATPLTGVSPKRITDSYLISWLLSPFSLTDWLPGNREVTVRILTALLVQGCIIKAVSKALNTFINANSLHYWIPVSWLTRSTSVPVHKLYMYRVSTQVTIPTCHKIREAGDIWVDLACATQASHSCLFLEPFSLSGSPWCACSSTWVDGMDRWINHNKCQHWSTIGEITFGHCYALSGIIRLQ